MQVDRGATRRGLAGVLTLLAWVGCSGPHLPAATGGTTDVLLLVDTPTLPDLTALQAALTAPSASQPEEPTFVVSTRTVTSRGEAPRDKNVVVVARQDGAGHLLPTLAAWLEAATRQRLAQAGGAVTLADVWARDQEVTLLVGRDAAGLDSLLLGSAAPLRQQLWRSVVERAARTLREREPTPLALELRQFGFRLAVPPAYRRLPARAGVTAVELACAAPTRVLTVFWRDAMSPEAAGRDETLLALQREVMRRLHGDSLRVDSVHRADAGARRESRGAWQNATDVAGGPFIAHFIYAPQRQRLYAVQGMLYAPGRRKQPFLVELEALLLTFQVEAAP